ncbi:MAG TPA: low affinity iron permease family protein [Planctomycetaceae bacterium]|jgi:low affinity Fe/Cu permease
MNVRENLRFFHLARGTARIAGHPAVFVLAVGTVIVWVLTGPFFQFSDTWQLVINTGTTVVTFLMVFLIQNSQNRDSIAIHLKLDELVRSTRAAQNTMLNLDELDEKELDLLLEKYRQLGKDAQIHVEAVENRKSTAREASPESDERHPKASAKA